jgi:hypothetical protein
VENKVMIHFLLIGLLAFNLCKPLKTYTMKWKPFINAVSNKTIRFASFRPPESPFATLERQVKVTGPDSVLELIRFADTSLLPSLIEFLKTPEKAWAAEIILTAITETDGKILESFSLNPSKWWDAIGLNAFTKWNTWYLKNRDKIKWDEKLQIFKTGE